MVWFFVFIVLAKQLKENTLFLMQIASDGLSCSFNQITQFTECANIY